MLNAGVCPLDAQMGAQGFAGQADAMHAVLVAQIEEVGPDDRMQMEVLMPVGMGPGQAGRGEAGELRLHLAAQLRLRAAGRRRSAARSGTDRGRTCRRGPPAPGSRRGAAEDDRRSRRHAARRRAPDVLRASATASSNPGSATMRLALVRIPSRCARSTAALTRSE